jgi:Na+/H+ antiporter NhaC
MTISNNLIMQSNTKQYKFPYIFLGLYLTFLLSTALGQGCLTIIVDILNYTGKLSTHDLISMMISGYLWKMSFAVILVFPAWLLVRFLKKSEGIDYYDINTNFNPFIFNLENHENLDSFKTVILPQ